MLFKRINRTDPEVALMTVKNGEASANINNGEPVVWDLTSADGVAVKRATTSSTQVTFAGVAIETITAGEYGLIQVYGYKSDVYVINTSTTADASAGAELAVTADGSGTPALAPAGGGVTSVTQEGGFALETIAMNTTTATQKKVFIKGAL